MPISDSPALSFPSAPHRFPRLLHHAVLVELDHPHACSVTMVLCQGVRQGCCATWLLSAGGKGAEGPALGWSSCCQVTSREIHVQHSYFQACATLLYHAVMHRCRSCKQAWTDQNQKLRMIMYLDTMPGTHLSGSLCVCARGRPVSGAWQLH